MPDNFFYFGSSIPKFFNYSGNRGNATSKAACAREQYFFNSILQICENDGDEFFFVSTGLTTDHGFNLISEIKVKNTRCIITATHHNLVFKKILQFLSICKTLHKYLNNNSIVVVYNAAPIYVLPLIIFWYRKYKLVIEVEDFYKKNTVKYYIHRCSLYLSASLSSLITISSVGQIKYLPDKCSANVIRNSGYILDSPISHASLDFGFTNKILIIYSGGLYIERGIGDLLEVFSSLDFDNICLFITGDGPMKKEVVYYQSIDNRVSFLGLLKDDDFSKLLSSCDILVNPQNISISENFPSKVASALSYGLAVVSTESVGIAESDFNEFISFYDGSTNQLRKALIDAFNFIPSLEEKNIRRNKFLNIMSNQTSNLQLNLNELRTFTR